MSDEMWKNFYSLRNVNGKRRNSSVSLGSEEVTSKLKKPIEMSLLSLDNVSRVVCISVYELGRSLTTFVFSPTNWALL
jgi:hypothetical protein